jgi:hypothetical protein
MAKKTTAKSKPLSRSDLNDMVPKLDHFVSSLKPSQQTALSRAFGAEAASPKSQKAIQEFLDAKVGNLNPHTRSIVAGVAGIGVGKGRGTAAGVAGIGISGGVAGGVAGIGTSKGRGTAAGVAGGVATAAKTGRGTAAGVAGGPAKGRGTAAGIAAGVAGGGGGGTSAGVAHSEEPKGPAKKK